MTIKVQKLQQIILESNFDADKSLGFAQILQLICENFLGTEYGAWQDGATLESLDDFNYQLDCLDCVTFVEVVLALAKANSKLSADKYLKAFEDNLGAIRYANGKTNFISRNHFQCLDWPENNKFIAEDITVTLTPNIKIAEAQIDKESWLRKHKLFKSQSEIPVNLVALLKTKISRIPYIETKDLLETPNMFIDEFPDYCIVNIIRPNWDLTEQIGTHLNISHLGFAFRDKLSNDILFYHASSIAKKVVFVSLFDYLSDIKDSPTIKGINVMAISPGLLNGSDRVI